jgi:SAM-dependent methyltransferase
MATCPICRSAKVREVYPAEITSGKDVSFSPTFSPAHNKTFGVYRCETCTHEFCHPVSADIGASYKDVVDAEYLRHAASRRLTARRLVQTLAAVAPTGKVVDIGCATGDFLEEARAGGFDCEGIEPCAWSGAIARERGFVVHPELLSEFSPGHRDEYDIATLWGVIEHFADPVAEVRRIAGILKPGGLLAIWTGDVDSITSRGLGRRWWYWQGQHIQYFTRRSLDRLLVSEGLSVVEARIYPFAASRATISNSLRRYRHHRLLSALVSPLFAIKPIWYLYLPGEMFVIARKEPTASH